jgi:ankyrin repeat protein
MQHLIRFGVDIDFSDNDGFIALYHAVLSGFEDCVQELINWGSDVNAMTQHGVPLKIRHDHCLRWASKAMRL